MRKPYLSPHVQRLLKIIGQPARASEARRKPGRPRRVSRMSIEELQAIIERCGGIRSTAREVGCCHTYLRLCLRGKRIVSDKYVVALRALWLGGMDSPEGGCDLVGLREHSSVTGSERVELRNQEA